MPALLSEASQNPELWSVDAPKPGVNMQVAQVKYNGAPAVLQLTPKSELGGITTPWTPNAFRGTGSESRVTITMNVPERVREEVELCEDAIRTALKAYLPNADSLWHSSTKPGESHPSTLRAKIIITGERACPCVDVDGNSVALPTDWSGLVVLPMLYVRAAYVQKSIAGLILEVTSLIIGERKTVKPTATRATFV